MAWKYKYAPLGERIIAWNAIGFLCTNLLFILNRWSGLSFDFMSLVLANSDPSYMLFRPWTIFTYMFAHEGLLHLAFNMLVLFFAARIFTTFLDEGKLLALYIAGGLGGFALFFLVYNIFPAFDHKFILGASASVMAILVGGATLHPDYEVRLFGMWNVKLIYIAIGYLLLDFLSLKGSDNLGGHLAHLGGAIIGFLMIRALKNGKNYFHPIQQIIAQFQGLFQKSSKIKVAYKSTSKKKPVRYDQSTKNEKQKRTDAILDKISKHGYESLSQEEKDFLFRAGQS